LLFTLSALPSPPPSAARRFCFCVYSLLKPFKTVPPAIVSVGQLARPAIVPVSIPKRAVVRAFLVRFVRLGCLPLSFFGVFSPLAFFAVVCYPCRCWGRSFPAPLVVSRVCSCPGFPSPAPWFPRPPWAGRRRPLCFPLWRARFLSRCGLLLSLGSSLFPGVLLSLACCCRALCSPLGVVLLGFGWGCWRRCRLRAFRLVLVPSARLLSFRGGCPRRRARLVRLARLCRLWVALWLAPACAWSVGLAPCRRPLPRLCPAWSVRCWPVGGGFPWAARLAPISLLSLPALLPVLPVGCAWLALGRPWALALLAALRRCPCCAPLLLPALPCPGWRVGRSRSRCVFAFSAALWLPWRAAPWPCLSRRALAPWPSPRLPSLPASLFWRLSRPALPPLRRVAAPAVGLPSRCPVWPPPAGRCSPGRPLPSLPGCPVFKPPLSGFAAPARWRGFFVGWGGVGSLRRRAGGVQTPGNRRTSLVGRGCRTAFLFLSSAFWAFPWFGGGGTTPPLVCAQRNRNSTLVLLPFLPLCAIIWASTPPAALLEVMP
jgi:hypothetical protein